MSLGDKLITPLIVRSLDKLTTQVTRLADLYESDLADRGLFVRPPKADTSGDEPEALYVDEEIDAVREFAEAVKRGEKRT